MKMRRVAWLAIALGLGMSISASAEAGGPGTGGRRVRLDDEPAGPYLVRVVTSPTPVRTPDLYLEIRVTDAASGATLTDVEVKASAVPVSGEGTPVEAIATHAIAPIPVEYGAHLPVDAPGIWSITVIMRGEAGEASVQFEEQVSRPLSLAPVLAVGLPIIGVLALVAVFLGLQRQSRRGNDGTDRA
jgi:hypothetical protein